ADLALYRAKAEGRGTYCFFEPSMEARARARRALEVDLRHALDNNQFELHYQPQVDSETHEIVAFEALLRWRHPQRGLLAASEFIAAAEETGLIVPLGGWVLRQACLDAAGWPDWISVAVNLSPVQFRNRDLTPLISQILQDTGLPASRLELEITESLLMKDVEINLMTLNELKALGLKNSMG